MYDMQTIIIPSYRLLSINYCNIEQFSQNENTNVYLAKVKTKAQNKTLRKSA
jgi:hypothetical protein